MKRLPLDGDTLGWIYLDWDDGRDTCYLLYLYLCRHIYVYIASLFPFSKLIRSINRSTPPLSFPHYRPHFRSLSIMNMYLFKCASIRMCLLSECAFYSIVHSIRIYILSKCAFYPNVHSLRMCILFKCAFNSNVHKYAHRMHILCTFYAHFMHILCTWF